MATFELILLLAIAVLLSSILDQLIPRVSSPLIQIGLGVIIAFLAVSPIEINIDPELFLVLFIAPLLFLDAMEADTENLWQNKNVILAFAIGLVLLITLCVGFALHWLIPSIPLAAAFALGAALGPTDAVAVASLKKEAKVGKRESSILQGEALLNDASGVVSFQFAIAAAVTGAFSLVDASVSFVVSFIGGIALGIVLAYVFRFISRHVKNMGLDNITFHVLFEVSMPFITFLACEALDVSGILAVVACGIVWSFYSNRRVSPYQSRLNIATSSVWRVLSYTLNGLVFVLLGMQLPSAMQSTWDDVYLNNFFLIGTVAGITVLIVLLRFAFALAMLRLSHNPETGKRERLTKAKARQALVTTVGGPKGAITLSIIFSIPFMLSDGTMFPQRSLIIFLASGVILCTLLLANFVLPILAPPSEEDDADSREEYALAKIEILRSVIERLMAAETDENSYDVKTVIARYDNRIRTLRDVVDEDAPSLRELRLEVIDHQAEKLIEAVQRRELDSFACFTYMRRLMTQKAHLSSDRPTSFRLTGLFFMLRTFFMVAGRKALSYVRRKPSDDEFIREVRITAEGIAISYLQGLVNDPKYPSELVARLLIGHERTLSLLDPELDTLPVYDRLSLEGADNVQRDALRYEIEEIQDSYASGKITRSQAKEMRDNVNIMMIDLEEHV